MIRLATLVALCASAAGCVFGWDTRTTLTSSPRPDDVHLVADTLPGQVELTADGRLAFTAEAKALCERERRHHERRRVTRGQKLSGTGWGLVGGGALAGGVGIYEASGSDEPVPWVGVASVGLLTAGIVVLIRYLGTEQGQRVADGERLVVDGRDRTACPPELSVDLVVQLPWGGSAEARLDAGGKAVFAIDWSQAPADAADAAARATVSQPWKITAVGRSTSTTWTPGPGQVTRVFALGREARDRVITGDTPAVLEVVSFQVDGGGPLVVGGSGLVQLTVANRGGSTALDVTGATKSGLPALDGVRFDLGKIQPGREVTRTAVIQVPAGTGGEGGVVLLVVSAGGGLAPAKAMLNVQLTRDVCAGGKLSRAEYDKKRARLLALRDAGELTAQEFDEYDAELLQCLR